MSTKTSRKPLTPADVKIERGGMGIQATRKSNGQFLGGATVAHGAEKLMRDVMAAQNGAESVRNVNTLTGRQAITCRFHGPTNTRGSRVTAEAAGTRVCVSGGGAVTSDTYMAACAELREKLGWTGPEYGDMIGGSTDRGDTYVFVFLPRR